MGLVDGDAGVGEEADVALGAPSREFFLERFPEGIGVSLGVDFANFGCVLEELGEGLEGVAVADDKA